MFNVNVKNKRVAIQHRAQASNGSVDLQTTINLKEVPIERIFAWAAKDRVAQAFPASVTSRHRGTELKKRFNNLVIDCTDPRQSHCQAERHEEELLDALRNLVEEGASIERLVQYLIKSTRKPVP